MMEVVLGPIPKAMAQAAKGAQNCFVGRDSRLNWPADASKRSIRYDHARQCKSKSSLFSTKLLFFEWQPSLWVLHGSAA